MDQSPFHILYLNLLILRNLINLFLVFDIKSRQKSSILRCLQHQRLLLFLEPLLKDSNFLSKLLDFIIFLGDA